jgi:hypothetical protein
VSALTFLVAGFIKGVNRAGPKALDGWSVGAPVIVGDEVLLQLFNVENDQGTAGERSVLRTEREDDEE